VTQKAFKVGEMVVLTSGRWRGSTAIISQAIAPGSAGHALLHTDGHIIGVTAAASDVRLATKDTQGFAQLAYGLIKLGSHVIEQGLI
jgi:hypothetical protein